MKWSLNLGRVFGIRVLVHWTFLILLAWVLFTEWQKGSDAFTSLLMVLYVLAIFACVVLHELGHSLTARHYGIKTKKITLLPIGGVASLERMPEKPKQELLVAIAGPAVNVAIAILLIPFTGSLDSILASARTNDLSITPSTFVFSLRVVNLFLVIFNAIPAFPMDGGRVLRAFLAMYMNRVRATHIASRLGQGIAVLFFIAGFFFNPFLVFIGIFVFFGAYSENVMVQHLEFIKGHKIREAMMKDFSTINYNSTVGEAVDKILSGPDTVFMVSDGDRFAGVLSMSNIIRVLKERGRDVPVRDYLETGMKKFSPDQNLATAYYYTQQYRNISCPVIENGKLVGLINSEKINEYIMIQSALSY